MNELHALTPVIILLLVGILSILLTRRLGLSPIVGYLSAGVVIGPNALGIIQESETTLLLAELGVVFLLFDIGLHFSLPTLWDARRDIFGLGPVQIMACGLVFGIIAFSAGLAPVYAVILGGALALSSTAVVIHTLAERKQQSCPVGITGTAVLIVQDVFAIFLLILSSSLADWTEYAGPTALSTTVTMAMLKAALAFLTALLIGRYAIKPLFRLFSQTRNEEVFTAMALLVVLATAAATGHAGLSLTLGAFLGGMIISETPYRHVIQTEAKPFRNLLLGFFFITVGMSLDWHMLIAHWTEIFAFLSVFVVLKALLIVLTARLFGWSLPGSVQLGFLLAQGSEFVFVIVAMPMVRQTVGEEVAGMVITAVAVSLACTPALASFGNTLARQLRRCSAGSFIVKKEMTPVTTINPVVIFGMDDIGRSVADALQAHGLRYDAVDGDYDRFLSASADGYKVAFGDADDIRLMETLAYAERRAVVLTDIRHEAAEALKPIMQDRYPNLTRFIAVDTEDEKVRLECAGLHPVISRSYPRGLDLASAVLRYQNVNEAEIQVWMQRQQERMLQVAVSDAETWPGQSFRR